MKKIVLLIAVFISFINLTHASSVTVTQLNTGSELLSGEGTLSDTAAFGSVTSIEPWLGASWSANAITYFDETNNILNWSGSTSQGVFDYSFTLTEGQVAWGLLFNWSGNNEIPVLNIMDCGLGGIGDTCTGIATPWQTNPFPGMLISFNGTVSAVPIPAAIWLFSSGFLGLIGLARHRKI